MFVINNYLWHLMYVDPNNSVLTRSDGVTTLGVTDFNSRTIYISNVLKGALLQKVITHEVCHCAMFSYGIFVPLELEELICDFVASHGREIIQTVDNLFAILEYKKA